MTTAAVDRLGVPERAYAWRDRYDTVWVVKNGEWGIQGWFWYPGNPLGSGPFRRIG